MSLITLSTASAQPLDTIAVAGAPAGSTVSVRDGRGQEYFTAPVATAGQVAFRAAGALGTHLVFVLDAQGRIADTAVLSVHTKTDVEDEGARYHELLQKLWFTMATSCSQYQRARINGKAYKFFVCWLRDHTHTLKGMKYFDGDIKTGFELYADTQREDGMVWDNLYPSMAPPDWNDYRFAKGNFVQKVEGGRYQFTRVPVEADVEFLFMECLYYTWKATGDTEWMRQHLDKAIKAAHYYMNSEYRWSQKYQLVKRGYTIDTWDFVTHSDRVPPSYADNVVDPELSQFCVMHGDNTGFAVGCHYLSEMLAVAGREEESKKFAALGDTLLDRLRQLAWNGHFFRHQVPENPSFQRDLGGVDEAAQVSLSNAYALNRGITHEESVAIIRTYQRIRQEMPPTSPGEWYLIYPPFPKGYIMPLWHYMNGGVSTIVAGELAHGAFEHGFEAYGADILDRLNALADAHHGHLDVCFRGAMEPKPERTFHPVDLRALANTDFYGAGAPGVPGWSGDGDNDLHNMPVGRQTLAEAEFDVIDPATNGRRAAIGVSHQPGYVTECVVPVGRKAASFYLLHTVAGGGLVGTMQIRYADGTHETTYVQTGRQLDGWFMPGETRTHGTDHALAFPKGFPDYQIAWRGKNAKFDNVGVFAYGHENPHPEKEIREIAFAATETGAKWFLLALTLSDQPIWFPQIDISYGIPDNWGAGAVVYALLEGLAGIKDTGRAFDRALLAPRWSAAGVEKVTATAKYEASGGYVRYRYAMDAKKKTVTVEVATCAAQLRFELLLPEGTTAGSATVNGQAVAIVTKKIEGSAYACLDLTGMGVQVVEVALG